MIVFIGLPPENGRGGQLVRCPPPAGIRETISKIFSEPRQCSHRRILWSSRTPSRSPQGSAHPGHRAGTGGAGPRCRCPGRSSARLAFPCGTGNPPAFRRRYPRPRWRLCIRQTPGHPNAAAVHGTGSRFCGRPGLQIFLRENLNGAAGNGTGDRVRAMLARCSGPTGIKKSPDSRKLFERKKHGIQLHCDNFRTGCQTGPVQRLGFF